MGARLIQALKIVTLPFLLIIVLVVGTFRGVVSHIKEMGKKE
jgi:hypothetical protein